MSTQAPPTCCQCLEEQPIRRKWLKTFISKLFRTLFTNNKKCEHHSIGKNVNFFWFIKHIFCSGSIPHKWGPNHENYHLKGRGKGSKATCFSLNMNSGWIYFESAKYSLWMDISIVDPLYVVTSFSANFDVMKLQKKGKYSVNKVKTVFRYMLSWGSIVSLTI